MASELDNVKVGDKLFVFNGHVKGIEIVERLTQTLVITKVHRFVKKTGDCTEATLGIQCMLVLLLNKMS